MVGLYIGTIEMPGNDRVFSGTGGLQDLLKYEELTARQRKAYFCIENKQTDIQIKICCSQLFDWC